MLIFWNENGKLFFIEYGILEWNKFCLKEFFQRLWHAYGWFLPYKNDVNISFGGCKINFFFLLFLDFFVFFWISQAGRSKKEKIINFIYNNKKNFTENPTTGTAALRSADRYAQDAFINRRLLCIQTSREAYFHRIDYVLDAVHDSA